MKKINKILFLLIGVFTLLLMGCKKEAELSDQCMFLGFVYDEMDLLIDDEEKIITINVANEVERLNIALRTKVSPRATFKIYEDAEKTLIVSNENIDEGENKYYLEIVAENGKNSQDYLIVINRVINHQINYIEEEGYSFSGRNNEELIIKVKDGEKLEFQIEIEENFLGFDYVVCYFQEGEECDEIVIEKLENNIYIINKVESDISIKLIFIAD